ncbi:MAG: Glycine/sarcosine/dimethylglycine N-methyltransferase [Candidatus Heimdallarchaeota archaeon LC_2]|nr:MAG: Glycine/sarcosine/dimethylglycine N-methyltransferase [Candidatus Heimdallarchaeota archaeon LC_2]
MNSWDPIWEDIHATEEWGRYPTEDLIRFVARNFYKSTSRQDTKFLDLGCGAGASSWYLAREGFNVKGVDGSQSAIDKARKYLLKENLIAEFQVVDFVKTPFTDHYFDCVIDIASIQHNPKSLIPRIIDEVHRVLKPNGKFFGIMVAEGTIGDNVSTNERKDGPLSGRGLTTFFSEEEVIEYFKSFKTVNIYYRLRSVESGIYKEWIISASKT